MANHDSLCFKWRVWFGPICFHKRQGNVYNYWILLMEIFRGKSPWTTWWKNTWIAGSSNSFPHAVGDILEANILSREELTVAKLDYASTILELPLHGCAELPEEIMLMNDDHSQVVLRFLISWNRCFPMINDNHAIKSIGFVTKGHYPTEIDHAHYFWGEDQQSPKIEDFTEWQGHG